MRTGLSGRPRATAARAAALVLALGLGCAACAHPAHLFADNPAPATSAAPPPTPTAGAPSEAAPYPAGRSLDADAHVPDLTHVDRHDPTAVALAWATGAYGSDTAYDSGPHDAQLRAAVLLDQALAAQVRGYTPHSGPGADWLTWAAHRSWIEVTATLDHEDRPPDTAGLALRQVLVESVAHGRDGWTGPGPRAAAFVSLKPAADGTWQVSNTTTAPM